MIAVYFFYGLAFFGMGLALLFATRRDSQFRFATAVAPLALFGLLHGAHEWMEMFNRIAAAQDGRAPLLSFEIARVAVLVASFILLQAFAILLLAPANLSWRRFWPAAALFLAWALATTWIAIAVDLNSLEVVRAADTMSRFLLAIPGAVMGAWALMAQQRQFRAAAMPQFGRDLVWAATALLLYGVVGQAFVREPSAALPLLLTDIAFQAWFGIPVQVFRAAMATILAFFMVRALRAYELEDKRRLGEVAGERIALQAAALEAERRASRQMEELNEELRLAAHKLSLLLDIANMLNAPVDWQKRLRQTLSQIVEMLSFADSGLILISGQKGAAPHISATVGFDERERDASCRSDASQEEAAAFGSRVVEDGLGLCLHADGHEIRFTLEDSLEDGECKRYASPTVAMALPLPSGRGVIGSLVLLHTGPEPYQLSAADLSLVVGIAQQLGVSVENALLQQEAKTREKALAALVRSVVNTQESERQRIARELHDATGQSLTAVALGLRGIELQLTTNPQELPLERILQQLQELQSFSTSALRELRDVTTNLRPPQLDDLGLAAAMRWHIQGYRQRRGIDVQFNVQGEEALLSPDHRTVLFRIMQEALTNIAKHAQAQQAQVNLAIGAGEVELTIEDDGRGFDLARLAQDGAAAPGWGLAGMRERANLLGGNCEVDSSPGRGTRIRVRAPLSFAGEVAGAV